MALRNWLLYATISLSGSFAHSMTCEESLGGYPSTSVQGIPARPGSNSLTAPTRIIVQSIDDRRKSPWHKNRMRARIQALLDRFVNLGFFVPEELFVVISPNDGQSTAFGAGDDASCAHHSINSHRDHVVVGRPHHAAGHETGHVVLAHQLWNDPLVEIFRQLRQQVVALEAEMIAKSLQLDSYFRREREPGLKGAFEPQIKALEASLRIDNRRASEMRNSVFATKFFKRLGELWADAVYFVETGNPHHHRHRDLGWLLETDPQEALQIRSRDFSESFTPETWQDIGNKHGYYGPVRSRIGACLRRRSDDQRFEFLRTLYEAIRIRINDEHKEFGDTLALWGQGSEAEGNRRFIQILDRLGCQAARSL